MFMKKHAVRLIVLSTLLPLSVIASDAEWSTNGNSIHSTNGINSNVGIGVTSPNSPLDVIGGNQDESATFTVKQSGRVHSGADGFALIDVVDDSSSVSSSDTQFYIAGRTNSGGAPAWGIGLEDGDIWTQGALHGGATTSDCGGTNAACFADGTFVLAPSGDSYLNGGNVGIGTSAPSADLHVVSQVLVGQPTANVGGNTAFRMDAGSASPDAGRIRFGDGSGWAFHMTRHSDGTDLVTFEDSGKVGIGTSSPSNELDIAVPSSTADILLSSDEPFSTSEGYAGSLVFKGQINTSGQMNNLATISGGRMAGSDGEKKGLIRFLIDTGGSQSEYMRIDGDGHVGIGTTSPATALDVSGSIQTSDELLFLDSNGTTRGMMAGTTSDTLDITATETEVNGDLTVSGGDFSVDGGDICLGTCS